MKETQLERPAAADVKTPPDLPAAEPGPENEGTRNGSAPIIRKA